MKICTDSIFPNYKHKLFVLLTSNHSRMERMWRMKNGPAKDKGIPGNNEWMCRMRKNKGLPAPPGYQLIISGLTKKAAISY